LSNRFVLLCFWIQFSFFAPVFAPVVVSQASELSEKFIPAEEARSHSEEVSDWEAQEESADTNVVDPGDFSRLKGYLGEIVIESDGVDSSIWRYEDNFSFSPGFDPKLRLVKKEAHLPYFSSSPWQYERYEATRRLGEIKLTQELNSFSFGTAFRHVDDDFKDPARYQRILKIKNHLRSDQERVDFWAAKKVGLFKVRGFYSRSWDNVAEDPERFQMLDSSGGTRISFKTPEIPLFFSLSYAKNRSESILEPEGLKPRGRIEDSFSGSLYYFAGSAFDVTLSSTYSPGRNSMHPEEQDEIFWHEIRANIRPVWHITITPALSYGDFRYLLHGERTETPSASLSISYSELFDSVDLSFWGAYSETRGTDQYQDDMTVNTAFEINWRPEYDLLPESNIGLKVARGRYIDRVYEDVYDDFSTKLSIRFPF